MSDAAQTLMTVDQFLATAEVREGRWEIESGVAYATALEQMDHARTKHATVKALEAAILKANLPCEAVPDSVAVRITARTAYQPDALIYCGPRVPGNTREIYNPVIVVEVISPTSRDRTLAHYKRADAGVIEFRIHYDGPLRLDPPGLALDVGELFPAD